MKPITRHIITLALVATLCSCAKQGMPNGGPKDETPPQLRSAQPANQSCNYTGRDFYIEFDEYVVLKDADNNVLVSPPLKNKPTYRTKGRGVQVRIADTLQPNTTYLFQFKNAIADFNEGNLLPSFEYVFSTGAKLDSLSLKGRVLDALTLQPNKETVTVLLTDASRNETLMVADTTNDSLATVAPRYVTRCDSNGHFAFNYIRDGVYYVTALVDENKNLQVDSTEAVAFSPSVFMPFNPADSNAAPSVIAMRLFTPKIEKQRLTSSEFKQPGTIQIASLMPMRQPVLDAGGEPLYWQLNKSADTLTLWTGNEKCDSLLLRVTDPSGINDTLRLRWRSKKGRPVEPVSSVEMKLSHKTLPFFDTLRLVAPRPLDRAHCRTDSVVSVLRLRDSSRAHCALRMDSSLLRLTVDYPFLKGEKYDINIPAAVLHDIYGKPSDSLHAVVTVTSPEQYGNLHLDILPDSSLAQSAFVIELLDTKGNVVDRRSLAAAGAIDFKHLNPEKYRLRAIVDDNGNGQWDPGDYRSGLQPERVVGFAKTLDIRANWDFEEKFIIVIP